ncbi:MAG TPA: VOC family protein [Polyangiales bacterium]|nr:VOC family protein [Polyangiales bacterium]
MQKLTPFLWFNDQAEEAAKLYVSIFKNSKITQTERYGDTGPGPKGAVMTVAFELEGQPFVALNGGPQYKFTPAVSFVANCTTQAEVDSLWDKLSSGGTQQPCGWLTDKFGLSWQVVPTILHELIHKPKVMQAMLQMSKLDIAVLQQAAKE